MRTEPPPLTEWIPPKKKNEDQSEDNHEGEENKSEAQDNDDGFVTVTKGILESVNEVQGKKNVIVVKPEENKEDTEPKDNEANDNEKTEEAPLQKVEETQENGDKNNQAEDDDSEDDEDNGKGWINPDNIAQKLYNAVKKEDKVAEMGVAVMTADFAMQVKSGIKSPNSLECSYPNWYSYSLRRRFRHQTN